MQLMSAESLERVWGCVDPDELFGVSPRTTTPWVRGGKDKRGATYDLAAARTRGVLPDGTVGAERADLSR